MSSVPTNIKNIIFDLGGVILDLSVDATLESFGKLAGISKQQVLEIFHKSPGFNEYEKGKMDDMAFRQYLKKLYNLNAVEHEIDTCWNAMLRGIPVANLELLKKLKTQYQTYLLSNTNNIHLSYVNDVMLPRITGETSLDHYFHRAYYSHRMMTRKPEPEIFERVLSENKLDAAQTLFMDDNPGNLEGARSVGIRTVHIASPQQMLEYFNAK